jgi:hypothetical protein
VALTQFCSCSSNVTDRGLPRRCTDVGLDATPVPTLHGGRGASLAAAVL